MVKIIHLARPVAGVGVYIQLLCKYLDSSNFQNEIILNSNDENINIVNDSNEKIKEYNSKLTREISFVNDLVSLYQIIKILRTQKPDILHCHSAKSGILGRIAGTVLRIKTIYTPHAYSYLSAESKKKKFVLKAIEIFFGFFPTYTVACSNSEYNRTINDLKISKAKAFVWKNSIENISKVKKSSYLKNIPKDYVCSIGRPSFQKNTELLVQAILEVKGKNPNIHLVILGVGFYSPTLKKIEVFILENNLSNNITLIPWLDRSESLSILKNSLLYVSSSRYEGLSYAVIEALALSKPCVLTNVDGNKDIVKNNCNGFLVEQNSDELASKISKILDNRYLRIKMGEISRKEFENFYQIKNNIENLENLYLLFKK